MKNNNFFLSFSFLLIGIFFALVPINKVQAASLFLSSSTKTYNVGSSFSVSLYVNSSDQSINAVTSKINFSQDKLSVVSISRSGSVINFWPEEPSFNNNTGVIILTGVVLNPGFTGKSGKIITINFKLKETGKANIGPSSAQILANDGLGTNVYKGSTGLQFVIDKEEPVVVPIKKEEQPLAIKTPASATITKTSSRDSLSEVMISSATNPDPDVWYRNNNPIFSWSLPAGTQSIGLAIDNKADTIPDFIAKNVLSSYQAKEIGDGLWFLHVQFLLSKDWTKTSHFRFNIDTTPPVFNDVSIIDKDLALVLPTYSIYDFFKLNNLINKQSKISSGIAESEKILNISASDELSGIAKYEVSINDQAPITLASDIKELPLNNLGVGPYKVEIKVFDIAGNYNSIVKQFNVPSDSSGLYLKTLKDLRKSQIKAIWTIIILLIIILFIIFSLLWRHFKSSRYYQIIKNNRNNGVSRVGRKLIKRIRVSEQILVDVKKRRSLTDDENKLLLLVSKIKSFYSEYAIKNKKISIKKHK